MLAGEKAPIIHLPCEKPKLALTISHAGNEASTAAGRAGHICHGCLRSVPGPGWGAMPWAASCSAGDTPPAPTVLPMEGAGHRLFFSPHTFEIQLQNTK